MLPAGTWTSRLELFHLVLGQPHLAPGAWGGYHVSSPAGSPAESPGEGQGGGRVPFLLVFVIP